MSTKTRAFSVCKLTRANQHYIFQTYKNLKLPSAWRKIAHEVKIKICLVNFADIKTKVVLLFKYRHSNAQFYNP